MTLDTDGFDAKRWDAVEVIASEIAGGEWHNQDMRDVYREQAKRVLDEVDAIRRRDPTPPASVESVNAGESDAALVERCESARALGYRIWDQDTDRMIALARRALTPPSTSITAAGTDIVSALLFAYRNYQGEMAERRAIPIAVRHGATEWHPEPQWLLRAFDLDKQAEREFAMADMGVSALNPSTPAPSAMPGSAVSEMEKLAAARSLGTAGIGVSWNQVGEALEAAARVRAPEPVRHGDAKGEALAPLRKLLAGFDEQLHGHSDQSTIWLWMWEQFKIRPQDIAEARAALRADTRQDTGGTE